MMYIEGYISKKAIRRMLENYSTVDSRGYELQEIRSPSNPNPDGISYSRLNKIMIDKAIDKMPEEIRTCVVNRWIEQRKVEYITNLLNISFHKYYSNCDKGIEIIYQEFNKERAGI